MRLKRNIDPESLVRDEDGVVVDASNAKAPTVAVQQINPDIPWHVSPRLLEKGLSEGWLAADGGAFTMHTSTHGDLVFRIRRRPGLYCCHDGTAHGSAREAQAHIAANFAEVESPDPNNPSGYEDARYFVTELETELAAEEG